jgi:hypothetical protein
MTPVGDIQVEVLLQELEFERMGSQQDTRYFRFKKRPNQNKHLIVIPIYFPKLKICELVMVKSGCPKREI